MRDGDLNRGGMRGGQSQVMKSLTVRFTLRVKPAILETNEKPYPVSLVRFLFLKTDSTSAIACGCV